MIVLIKNSLIENINGELHLSFLYCKNNVANDMF